MKKCYNKISDFFEQQELKTKLAILADINPKYSNGLLSSASQLVTAVSTSATTIAIEAIKGIWSGNGFREGFSTGEFEVFARNLAPILRCVGDQLGCHSSPLNKAVSYAVLTELSKMPFSKSAMDAMVSNIGDYISWDEDIKQRKAGDMFGRTIASTVETPLPKNAKIMGNACKYT